MSDQVRIAAIGAFAVVLSLAMLLMPDNISLIWTLVGGLFAAIGIPFVVRIYQIEQQLIKRIDELEILIKAKEVSHD